MRIFFFNVVLLGLGIKSISVLLSVCLKILMYVSISLNENKFPRPVDPLGNKFVMYITYDTVLLFLGRIFMNII